MKKIIHLFSFILISFFVFGISSIHAQSNEKVSIEILGRPDCPHCVAEYEFFDELSTQRDDFTVTKFNIQELENKVLFEKVVEASDLSLATPITLVGQTVFQGFDKPETTGKLIEELIDNSKGKEQLTFATYLTQVEKVDSEIEQQGACDEDTGCAVNPLYVDLPFLGVTDVKQYSLPILSIILGFIDGFNPCAMWVLVSFLLILSQVGDKKKMWTFAGLFIVAEAIMYTLILTLWFSTWDFVGMDKFVTPIVGLLAIGGGIFFLYEWKTAKEGECKVTNLSQRQKTTNKIKELASKKLSIATAIGIVFLAFSVNVIEFACSIGIPQAFTKILEINGHTLLSSLSYLGLYILFYMIDDFIVLGIALYSFEKIGLTGKYSKLSNLIGGILMLILGFLLIFKPELLMFS